MFILINVFILSSDEAGHHTGFGIDVLHAVCQKSNVECNTVMDDNSNCITTAGTGKDRFYVGGKGGKMFMCLLMFY